VTWAAIIVPFPIFCQRVGEFATGPGRSSPEICHSSSVAAAEDGSIAAPLLLTLVGLISAVAGAESNESEEEGGEVAQVHD
jgi:hypothetical protein